ncbi:hypothetical protein [Wukongibacter baidiensis]
MRVISYIIIVIQIYLKNDILLAINEVVWTMEPFGNNLVRVFPNMTITIVEDFRMVL